MNTKCGTPDDQTILLEEMSHRFFNSLHLAFSMIGMLGRETSPGDGRGALASELQQRIAILERLHRRLGMPVKEDVDLPLTCEELCLDLVTAFGRADTALSFDLKMIAVCPRIARYIVLILAELVTNAVKHARTEKALWIAVALGSSHGMCGLRVCSSDEPAEDRASDSQRMASPRVATILAQATGGLIEARLGRSFEVDVLLPGYALPDA